MKMNQYLIEFTYDHQCQRHGNATTMVLVSAYQYQEALERIARCYKNARLFKDKTLNIDL